MNMKSSSVIKYVGSAMALGGTVMLGTSVISSGNAVKRKAKKTALKAIDAIDTVLTSVQNIVK